MKIIAFNGSPHKQGNTAGALEIAKKYFEANSVDFEIIQVGSNPIAGCTGCGWCFRNKNSQCVLGDEIINSSVEKIKSADGIILASPVHYSGIAGNMKSFLDRLYYVCGANGGLMRRKVGASIVAVRRSGGVATFDQLNHYHTISESVIASSNYWNVIHGTAPGEITEDLEGIQTIEILCENILWLLKSIEYSKDAIEKPEKRKKISTNFVR